MTWAAKRRIMYLGALLILFTGLLVRILWPYFHEAPTCTDKKQNGAETGVDCGGMCAIYCPGEAKPISVSWSRSFLVTDGVYNAVAYIENKNQKAGIYKVGYEFKFYDDKNLFITNRTGSTFVAPNGRSAIFEPNIVVSTNRPIKRTTFAFTNEPRFLKVNEKFDPLSLITSAGVPTEVQTSPKLEAKIKNRTPMDFVGVESIAILYDKDEIAIGASKTYLDGIKAGEQNNLYFSWLLPFSVPVATTEIFTRFDPFTQLYK